MEFAEVDGLEMTMEPKTVREGGNNTRLIHLPGPVTYGTLTLKRGMTQNQDIWIWFAAIADGTRGNAYASGVIRQNARNASVTNVSYELQGCLPVKVKAPWLNAKDGIVAIEVRMDSAFFSDEIVSALQADGIEFTLSVPFERFFELKGMIEGRQRWRPMSDDVSYFEADWKPKVWDRRFRFLFIRTRAPAPEQRAHPAGPVRAARIRLRLQGHRYQQGPGRRTASWHSTKDEAHRKASSANSRRTVRWVTSLFAPAPETSSTCSPDSSRTT